jgi:hypothetical protein
MRLIALACAAAVLCAAAADFEVRDGDKTVVVSPAKAPATVIVFVSSVCPISNAYLERLNGMHTAYRPRGVQFVFVNSNVNEAPADIAEHAKDNQLAFPVYTDPGRALADRLHAQMTPEAYVFDRSGELRYHGRIDDAVNAEKARTHDLQDVLEAMLTGHQASTLKETRAFGCTIKRSRI